MSLKHSTLLAAGAVAIGFTIAASGLAVGQQWGLSGPGSQLGMPQYMRTESHALAQLGNNEGIYVDKNTFKLHMGKPKSNQSSEALRAGAREVANGAIIFRSEGKLYIVDAKPAAAD
jgi:hypothetical protein